MIVVVIGATGTIGSAVVKALSSRHEVIPVARSSGEFRVDIVDKQALERVLREVAPFDAIVCAAGEAAFRPLGELTDGDFQFSLSSKLMWQVNVVRVGSRAINDNGSITITSGVLAAEPMPGSAAVSLVNAGLEGFTRAAALELSPRVRVNCVSPPWVSETLAAMGMDPSGGMPAADVAAAYVQSVEGKETGRIIDARTFAR